MRINVLCSVLPLVTMLALSTDVAAQPGMTPPGSTPPYSEPPPASPGPAGPPADDGYGPQPYPSQPDSPQPYSPQPYSPQPYYGPPMPPQVEPQGRTGYHIGFSGGIGSMESDVGDFACNGCDPIATNFELHVGRMLGPRFALQAELWFVTQSLEANGTASINQVMYMLAAQYWVHRQVWLRAGIGGSNLSLSYETGFGPESESLGNGVAMQIGAGLEMIHTRRFSLDVMIKAGVGSYDDRGESITATTLNLGVNWY